MLTAIGAAILALGIWIGWRLRGFWEARPNFLKRRKKDAAASEAAKDGTPANGESIVGKATGAFSRLGERIIGKGVETVMGGKPKDRKDDKEKP